MRLLVATTNQDKVREIVSCSRHPVRDRDARRQWPDLAAPEETGAHLRGQRPRSRRCITPAATGELTVAEDSGLEIDALDGAPGVESARFGGADPSYPDKFALIYDALARDRRDRDRTRAFRLRARAGKRRPHPVRNARDRRRPHRPRAEGHGGFGYDPIFFYPPYGQTLAEAGDRKAAVSHRGEAFRSLREFLPS